MVFQQFGGINGICFYTGSIFESSGTYVAFPHCQISVHTRDKKHRTFNIIIVLRT